MTEEEILKRYFKELGKGEDLPPEMKEDVMNFMDASRLFCDFVDLLTAKQLNAQAAFLENLTDNGKGGNEPEG